MDKYINAKSLYNQVAEKEELARQRVIDTPSRLPNGDVNPYAIRYAAQLDERTTFKFMLADAPAADVAEVQHGRWEKVDDNPYEYVGMCSVCRNEVKQPTCMLKPIYSYCPICGALMDEVLT